MSQDELLEIADPVERAGLADELMWTSHPHRTSLRTLRGQAIREALDAGRQATDVAARLRVTVADLQWMAGRDGHSTTVIIPSAGNGGGASS
jgi:hypothetical protein